MADGINSVSLPLVASPQLETQQAAPASRARAIDTNADSRKGSVSAPGAVLRPDVAAKEIKNDANQHEAQVARRADEAFRVALDKLDGMMTAANAIVKNYPPFPPGSIERRDYLNSISGLRKELAAMMYPPPADSTAPEPVFFPREDARVLEGVTVNEEILPPQLDPQKATDEDVSKFLARAENTLGSIEEFLARIEKNVEAVAEEMALSGSDSQVLDISRRLWSDLGQAQPGVGSDVKGLMD